MGGVNWIIVLCLFGVFVFVYFVMWKGIKSFGKVIIYVLKIEIKSLEILVKISKYNIEIN